MTATTQRTIIEQLYIITLKGLSGLSIASMGLLAGRIIATHTLHFGFLVWNLLLAWLPALFAWYIVRHGAKRARVTMIFWLAVWLLFLPNTFYILSDLIHLEATGTVSKLFDAVLVVSFAGVGLGLGVVSMLVVHVWLMRYLRTFWSWVVMTAAILASSFAIYLGRYLRWNSWDVVSNPLGLLVDVSDRVVNPAAHPRTLTTTALFFGFIAVQYVVVWLVLHSAWSKLRRRFLA